MKVAIAQVKLYNDVNANLMTISKYIRLASKDSIDILCFPECNITGYVRDFSKISQTEINEALDTIQEQVTKDGVNVIVGVPYFGQEKLFNSAVVILRNGEQHIYYKTHLTSFEEKYFEKGEKTLVFDLCGLKFGILICRDQNDPALAQEYKTLGVDVIVIISAHFYNPIEAMGKRDKNRALPIARAVENNLCVVKVNAVGSNNGKVSLGGSLIADPTGFIICEGDNINETLLSYEMSKG